MRKIVSKFALAAGVSLALAFTFSCSSDGGGEATYRYTAYGVTDTYACAELYELIPNPGENYNRTFDELYEFWYEIRKSRVGEIIVSREESETKLRDDILNSGGTPSEVNKFLNELDKRGNHILWTSDYSQYCLIVHYFEKM